MRVSINRNLSHLVLSGTLCLRNTDISTCGINLKVTFEKLMYTVRLNPVATELNFEDIRCTGECLEVPFSKMILKIHWNDGDHRRHFQMGNE